MSSIKDDQRPHVAVLVEESSGHTLSWLVAQVLKVQVKIGWSRAQRAPLVDSGHTFRVYSPLQDKELIAGLVKRFPITVYPDDPVSPKAVFQKDPSQPHLYTRQHGATVEEAVLRCLVAAYLGDRCLVPAVLVLKHEEPVTV